MCSKPDWVGGEACPAYPSPLEILPWGGLHCGRMGGYLRVEKHHWHVGSCSSLLPALPPLVSLPIFLLLPLLGGLLFDRTVPATMLRLGGCSLKPRCRLCPMLATGSMLTAHRTSWLPSEASWPKSCGQEEAGNPRPRGPAACSMFPHKMTQAGTERA